MQTKAVTLFVRHQQSKTLARCSALHGTPWMDITVPGASDWRELLDPSSGQSLDMAFGLTVLLLGLAAIRAHRTHAPQQH